MTARRVHFNLLLKYIVRDLYLVEMFFKTKKSMFASGQTHLKYLALSISQCRTYGTLILKKNGFSTNVVMPTALKNLVEVKYR